MNQSKFYLWRACFSFCFVDGFLSPEEKAWVDEKLNMINFSDSQKQTLIKDLVSPPDIDQLLPLVTSPADRGFLVNHIRLLSKIDKTISEAEKKKIEMIEKAVLSKIDLKSLQGQVAQVETEEDEFFVHNKHSYVEKVLKGLMRKMGPEDYKQPRK